MPRRGTESEFELTTIDRLELLGYQHLHGSDLAGERSGEEEVVLRGQNDRFDVAGGAVSKKGAKYHQFFAVRRAVERTLEVAATPGERRIGVIWHTTGSGKSLSMAFLVGILRRRPELENPSFVIQVDRRDLDDQLHDQFVASRSLVGPVRQAETTDHLRRLLDTAGGEVVFTTIEKFRLKRGEGGAADEIEHPVLSTRRNLIVIADEAHRSQYGFTRGYARYLAEALPHALRLGFTGTPISFSGADTVEVFGDYIHTYDIRQSELDRATVPIYYEPRQVRLHLGEDDLDAALEELAAEADPDEVERRKGRWAALARAAGAEDRLATLARDLLDHFRARTGALAGKAMVVCMTRENCVRLHEGIMPPGVDDWGDWRSLSRIELEDRYSLVYGHLSPEEGRREHFLAAEHRLSRAFLLVKHLDDCRPYADEIIFFQRVRKQLAKVSGREPRVDLDHERLQEVVVEDRDVSLLDAGGGEDVDHPLALDRVVDQVAHGRERPLTDLRLQLLEKLVRDELKRREKKNLAQAKSFQELLEETLQRYHNRLIDAAAVIRAMIEIRESLESQDRRAEELGLKEEELAFYDAISEQVGDVYDDPFLRSLVHDVVRAIKRNLKVDWTEPHREDVRAGVRLAVKRVLARRGVEPGDFDKILPFVMQQAEAAWREWGMVA